MERFFRFLLATLFILPSHLQAEKTEEFHSGIDFYVGSGINAKDGATSIPFEILLSKPIIPGISVGFGGGYESLKMDGVKSGQIPLFLDGKISFRLSKGISSLSEIRLGYSIGQDTEIKSGKKTYKVDGANGFMIGVMPAGLRFGLGKCLDLDLALGISLLVPSGGGKTQTYYGGRLGFNFHKANKVTNYGYSVNEIKEEKPKVIYPTRKNGFEFGFEGTCLNGYGAGIFLGYKVNPKLSMAIGTIIKGGKAYKMPDWTVGYYSQSNGEGEPFITQEGQGNGGDFDVTWTKFFVRGEYRFIDKSFSPIARLDVGYTKSIDGAQLKRRSILSDDPYDTGEFVGGFSVHPAVGASWRCTKNSYLEIALGYEIIPGVKSIDKVFSKTGNYGGSASKHYQSIRVKEGSINVSGMTIGLTWKHTTKWFSSTKPLK